MAKEKAIIDIDETNHIGMDEETGFGGSITAEIESNEVSAKVFQE